MGRGGRNSHSLPLAPLAPLLPTHDQVWLDALSQFDRAAFHAVGTWGCDIPLPYQAPRFVVIPELRYLPSQSSHTFQYYETLDEFLGSRLLAVRTEIPEGTRTHLLEYQPRLATFNTPLLVGCLSGYVPADVPHSSQRVERLQAIAQAYRTSSLSTFTGQDRFAIVSRNYEGEVRLHIFSELSSLAAMISSLAVDTYAFLSLFDLDVSDRPAPIRLGFRYVDQAGILHEVFEI